MDPTPKRARIPSFEQIAEGVDLLNAIEARLGYTHGQTLEDPNLNYRRGTCPRCGNHDVVVADLVLDPDVSSQRTTTCAACWA